MNVAVTAMAALMVTAHAPVPEQAPLQPANPEPIAATGVRFTTVPWLKAVAQVLGQSIPAGLLVTEPVPVPVVLTVSVSGVCVADKLISHALRPWVAARRVREAACNFMPTTATLGRPLEKVDQLVPPLLVMNTPVSVAM